MKFHFIGILLFLISALGFTLHSGQIPPYPYIKAVLLNIMVGATNVLLRYCSNINLQLSAYYLAEDTLAYGWPELCDNLHRTQKWMRSTNFISGFHISLPGCHAASCTHSNMYKIVKNAIYPELFLQVMLK